MSAGLPFSTERTNTPSPPLSARALGSLSRAYVDMDAQVLYAGINYPGTLGYVGAISLKDGAVRKIRDGASVLLYAEGTRTRDGLLQPFKRGAFNIAVRAGIPVVPLIVNGTFPILPKGSMIVRPRPVEIVLETPIQVGGEGKGEEMRLMEEVHQAIERNYRPQGPGAAAGGLTVEG